MKIENIGCSYCFETKEPLRPVDKEWVRKEINTGKKYNLICPFCWVSYGKYEYPYPEWWN